MSENSPKNVVFFYHISIRTFFKNVSIIILEKNVHAKNLLKDAFHLMHLHIPLPTITDF